MADEILTPEQQAATDKENTFWASIDEKVTSIAKATQRRITPIVIKDIANNGEYITGFMYRPDLTTQLRLSDRGQEYPSGFCQEEASKVLQSLLIVSESDQRINMTTDEGELYWKGALLCLYEFVKSAIPAIKKK